VTAELLGALFWSATTRYPRFGAAFTHFTRSIIDKLATACYSVLPTLRLDLSAFIGELTRVAELHTYPEKQIPREESFCHYERRSTDRHLPSIIPQKGNWLQVSGRYRRMD